MSEILTSFNRLNLLKKKHDDSPRDNNMSINKCINRRSSNFNIPQPINIEAAEFFKIPIGTLITRIDFTRMIHKYIKNNGLRSKENCRKINPDDKLKAFLKIDDVVELTYFNLPQHIARHFKKV